MGNEFTEGSGVEVALIEEEALVKGRCQYVFKGQDKEGKIQDNG